MSLISIQLDWLKDLAGYELVDHGKRGPYIIGKGGHLARFRPLECNDVVFIAFAKVSSPAALLNFVGHYGLLKNPAYERPFDTGTRKGHAGAGEFYRVEEVMGLKLRPTGEVEPAGERVADHLETAALFRRAMTGGVKGIRRDPLLTALADAIWDEGPELGDLIAEVNSKQGFHLRIAAKSLLAGLWLQLAQRVLGHGSFNTCRLCGSVFEVGAASGRRADAKFCSDAHRVEFNSRKRSKRS